MTTTPQSVRLEAECASSPSPKVTTCPPSAARSTRVELLVLASVALGAAGQLLLKASLLLVAKPPILTMGADRAQVACAAGVLAGLCIYAIGTIFWVRAVSRASISYLYPLSAGSYALVALGGHVLFGEVMPTWRWFGIAVMSVGVAMLAVGGERGAA